MSVEEEKLKLCQIEFTSEETEGLTVKRKISLVRAGSLKDCYEYTVKLHSGCAGNYENNGNSND